MKQRLHLRGLLQAVIALPRGFLPGTEVSPFLWVLAGAGDPRKQLGGDYGVLLVEPAPLTPVSGEVQKQVQLDVAQIEGAVNAWVRDARKPDEPKWFCHVVPGGELIEKGFAPQLHLPVAPVRQTVRPDAPAHLLTELTISNFKGVGANLRVPLRPLTLIYGGTLRASRL